jgi:hypothetical protein
MNAISLKRYKRGPAAVKVWGLTVYTHFEALLCIHKVSYLEPRQSTGCPKKIVPFLFCTLFYFFFPRCPLCGEWCKLHWLLLDTPTFDWNTRRSRGHKIFKMAPTKQNIFEKGTIFFGHPLFKTQFRTSHTTGSVSVPKMPVNWYTECLTVECIKQDK